MQTKLTLRMDERLIQQAKEYAKEREKSLSQIMADYLRLLITQKADEEQIGPITQSLIGVLESTELDLDEADYKKHLEEKYL